MQIFCGTDIIEVSRIKNAVENTKGFKENIYSGNEIKDIDKIKSDMKYQRYAGRFAVKEAMYKAMSKILIENNLNMGPLDIEVINDINLNRRPKVNILNESIKEFFKDKNIDIDVSISHVKDNAIAMVIVKLD